MNKYYALVIILLINFVSALSQTTENQLQLQYRQKIEYKKQVYDQILQSIRENPDSEELDQFYFNLAELSCDVNESDPALTASYYRQILRYNSNFSYKDIVYYNIAYFTEKSVKQQLHHARREYEGQSLAIPDSLRFSDSVFKTAIDHYKRLLEEFPTSSYYDESAWRLAELYFLIGSDRNSRISFMRADDLYSLTAQRKGSRYYFQSMLGKAWAKFELAEYDSTLTIAIDILNSLNNGNYIYNNEIIQEETVKLVAWIIVNMHGIDFADGNIAIAKMELKLRDISDKYWQDRIILQAGYELLNNNYPLKAKALFLAFLELYPESESAPDFSAALIEHIEMYPYLYDQNDSVQNLITQKQDELLNNYKSASAWYKNNRQKRIASAVKIIRNVLEIKEPQRYNAFLDLPDRAHYLKYQQLVDMYSGYKEISDQTDSQKQKQLRKNLVYFSQMLAQASDSIEDFQLAVTALEDFNRSYPKHERYVEFSKNIFFCYEKLYRSQSSFAGYDSLYIAASHQYEDILRQDENWQEHLNELSKVIFKRAEYQYNAGYFDEALQDYLLVTEIDSNNDLIIDSFRRSAEIAIEKEDYDLAEGYFREALKYSDGYIRVEVFDNILSTIEKKADALLVLNQPDDAANEFLRLSAELQDVYPQRSIQFFSRAIDVYEELGNDAKVKELLEFSSRNQTPDQAIALFYNTWQEADKLNDWNRSIAIRNNFISLFPNSNEAFRAKLQIIDIYENKLDQKDTAAQMYLQLFNDRESYNIGAEKPENIYLNAIRIYQNTNDIGKTIEHTQKFTDMFPDYSTVDLNLTYNDTDNYQTKVRKLKKLKDNINYLFVAEEYDLMKSEISSFRQISSAVNADSLMLDLNRDNARFDLYLNYAEYFSDLKASLSEIENEYLLQSASSMIPVTKSTRWQEQMVSGENRIGSLKEKCDNYRNQIFALLAKGSDYPLQISNFTHAIWVVAAAYDHAFKAVDQQVRNFVVKSDQLNSEALQNNKYLQSELKRRVIAEGDEYSFLFKLEAARLYQNLLYNYYDGKAYSDLWTRKSLARLNEWGIRELDGDIVAIDENLLLAEDSYANEEIETAYNNIFQKYQQKEYLTASSEFMDFIDSFTGHSLSYYALYYAGESYYNMGQLSKARDIFEKVLDFGKDKSPDALMRLGNYYNQTGNKKEAFAHWNRLISEYPDHYLAQIAQLTMSQLKAQEDIAVQQIASRDISEDRKIVLKYRKYMQYYKKGKYKSAEKGFRKFYKNYPDHELASSSLFMQAESHFRQNELEDALNIYDQVIDQAGNKAPVACYRSGLIYQQMAEISMRDQYWQKLIDDYPDHYLAYEIAKQDPKFAGSIKTSAKPQRPTRRVSEKTYSANTNTPQYKYKKAMMLYKYQNFTEAILKLKEFITSYPKNRLAHNAKFLLAESYQRTGQHAEAIDLFNALLPTAGSRRPEVLLLLAENYLALNNMEKAEETLNSILYSYNGTFHAVQARKLLQQIPGRN